MLEQIDQSEILPSREINDEEYLDQAEGEIRGYGRLLVSGIVAIGKKLTEVKNRVGHGRYGQFIRDRLEFSERTAQQFVQSYDFLRSAQCADFASLQIDASALRLLARPSTPEAVRAAALEKAATDGISHGDVQKLIADAKAEAAAVAKEEADKEAAAKLALQKKNSEAAVKTAAEKQGALAEQIRLSDMTIAQTRQRVVELEAAAATIASDVEKTVRADFEAKYQGKLVLSEEDLRQNIQATVDQMTQALNRRIKELEKHIDGVTRERDAAVTELAGARERQTAAEAADPPRSPIDSKLYGRAMDAGRAIAHCVTEIRLSPAELIAIEAEVATGLQQRPDVARENLQKIAAAIGRLSPWFGEFIELYEEAINRQLNRNEVRPAVADVPLATHEAKPAKTCATRERVEAQPALPLLAPALADQQEDSIAPKRGRGRPDGSQDLQPGKKKSAPLPTVAEQSANSCANEDINDALSQTNSLETVEPELRDAGSPRLTGDLAS